MESSEERKVLEIADLIKPHLAGQGSAVQGYVLADLVSIWLVGHITNDGDKEHTDEMRGELFAAWCRLVLKLLPINHDVIHESSK